MYCDICKTDTEQLTNDDFNKIHVKSPEHRKNQMIKRMHEEIDKLKNDNNILQHNNSLLSSKNRDLEYDINKCKENNDLPPREMIRNLIDKLTQNNEILSSNYEYKNKYNDLEVDYSHLKLNHKKLSSDIEKFKKRNNELDAFNRKLQLQYEKLINKNNKSTITNNKTKLVIELNEETNYDKHYLFLSFLLIFLGFIVFIFVGTFMMFTDFTIIPSDIEVFQFLKLFQP